MTARMGPIVAFAIINTLLSGVYGAQYFGKLLGKLSELHHGVSGEVYAVDGRTLFVKDFTYDGQGPAAYFYASTSKNANSLGFRLRDENGSPEVIRRYRKEGITLTLPEGKTLNNIKIFYVWCEEFEVNFGDVKIPRNFDYPRPQKIEPLKGVHAISSDNIVIVDAQTLLIPNLSYDGEAPDAKFWVGRGPKPSPQGIRVPDENGKEIPLRRYDRKTVVLTLPGDLTVFDIGHFGIWCEAFTVDFGHVQIPKNLNIPPSLKMLGVSPQSKLNCEVLYDDLAFEVRWAVAGDSIVLQLVAKLGDREYMSFGISGDDSKSEMIGGDVVVAWVDKETLKGYAEDYYLGAKSQCSGPTGSCPDKRLAENTNNIRLLNAAMVNGYSIVTYQRPLKPSDEYDRQIHTNRSQAIIWAIGPLNQRDEVSFHDHYTKGDKFLNFGRPAKWNCPMPESEQPPMKAIVKQQIRETTPAPTTAAPAPTRGRNNERRRGSTNRGSSHKQEEVDSEKSATASRGRQTERRGSNRRGSNAAKTVPTPAPVAKRNAWDIPAIQCYEPEDGVFYAQMGPTGGKRGYSAITGHVGWGISWYINGLLIPEINVVRGKTYTFVVEGGFDPEVAAKYHPFYITDDSVGGYEYKTDEEKKKIRIFAGAITAKDGSTKPTGTGRLCHWTQQGDLEADDFESFGAYQRTLELKCDQGEPGVIQWTPDKNTPDTVYYQCFTHRYLGWKINVHDSCDVQSAASEPEAVIVQAPEKSDLEESPSTIIETRVKPNDLIVEDKEDKDKSTISEKNTDPPIIELPQGQPQKQLPINKPIPIQIQQHYFNPASHMNQGLYFTPYQVVNPFHHNFYQQTFKPSLPLDDINKDFENIQEVSLEAPKTTTLSSISSTASASTVNISTTAITTTAIYSSTSKPETNPSIGDQIISAASDVKPLNQNVYHPPTKTMYSKNNFSMRRPLPPKYRPMPRPVIRFSPNKMQIYRPIIKMPIARHPPNHYYPMHSESKWKMKRQPPNYIILKPQILSTPLPTSTPIPSPNLTVTKVEISPQQASTEREPDTQTVSPSPLVIAAPVKEKFYFNLRPALNTGFHPESVVIEGGFRPILSKEFQKRISEDEPDLKYESEIGVIVPKTKNQPQQSQYFKPMFVPSPLDKNLRNKNKSHKMPYVKKVIIKHTRSLEADDFEPIAEAAERVESYYLPPLGTPPKLSSAPRQKSNIDLDSPAPIDLDSPPDVVVTYDGKKVSGASLTAKLADRSSAFDMRASKAAELIKARPQFAPYKGDLPPLNPEYIIKNIPQLQSRGVLSRDLDTPPIPPSGSTKLSLVRNNRDVGIDVNTRKKRAAHHTPEHTAEQERQRNNNSTTKGSASKLYGHMIIFVVAYFLRYV